MHFAEAIQQFLHGLVGISSESATHYLQLVAGILGVALALWRMYAFGRDRFVKKFRNFMMGEEGFWDRRPRLNSGRHMEAIRKSIPILMMANYKGGVSKSTTTANLGAYFDSVGLRVLLIDLDYQGSLTEAVINKEGELVLGSVYAIDPPSPKFSLFGVMETPLSAFRATRVLAASYSLNRTENRVVFKWLVGETAEDVRFRLHKFLSSKTVQDAFDIVLIDCPPRLSTATANAICASTHVLVPAILDNLSASAATRTVDSLLKMRNKVSPGLEVLGVVPTFVEYSTRYLKRELEALDTIKDDLRDINLRMKTSVEVLEDERVLRKAAISSVAGQAVAFFEDESVREMYSALGLAVAKRLGGLVKEKAINADQKIDLLPGVPEKRRVAARR